MLRTDPPRPAGAHGWPACGCEDCLDAYLCPRAVARAARVVLATGLVVLLALVLW